jgi:nucleotide-binding universal stress UspA family protein
MQNTVLVAVDGSEGSSRALQYAIARAKNSGATLLLVHVIDWSPYSFHTNDELAQRQKRREEELDRARDKILKPMIDICEEHAINIETKVAHGKTTEIVNNLALENDVAQVVMGRRGTSSVKSMIFGSIAANLVQTSPVPVTIVP